MTNEIVKTLPQDVNEDIEELEAGEPEAVRYPHIYILHHADQDGYAAGAVCFATMAHPKRTMVPIPVQYGEPFPSIDLQPEDSVFILDFSYRREILESVKTKVSELLVLDHHETARQELEGLPYAHFDMSKSGALLAWEYFVEGCPPYECIELLDCYDLWNKNHPKHSWEKVVKFHMANQPFLKNFYHWVSLVNTGKIPNELLEIGEDHYSRFSQSVKDVKESVSTEYRTIKGKRFCFFFCKEDISLISDAIYSDKENPVDVTVCLFQKENSGVWVASLRSPDDRVQPVHTIAQLFGGGGHKQAAGMVLGQMDELDLIPHLVHLLEKSSW